MLDSNLIVIYGKSGSGKSTLGVSLINSVDNACYINAEGNPHIRVDEKVKVFRDKIDLSFVEKCIEEYKVVLVDYLDLLGISYDKLPELKELAKVNNATLIVISNCSCTKELINEYYNQLKEVVDLMIMLDK